MRITSHFTACAACILTLTAASAIFVSGQALRFGDADLPAYDPTNFAANNSDFIATQLLTAKNHIKEAASVEPGPEQDRIYRLAAEALQEVLNTGNLHEQVVRSGDEHERWTGALENCESIIRDLPERGRAVYEELFRDRAAIELDLALNGRDETRFRSLLQRYALTDSGRRAARLFARQMFERGDFQQAAYALKRLLDILTEDGTEQLQTVRASIVAELAFCYHRLGMQAPLQALATTNSAICELLVNAGSEKNSLQDYLTYLIGRTPDTVNAPAHTRHLSLPIYSLSNMARPESPQHITASAWSVNPPPPGGKIYNSDFMNYPEPEIPPLLPSVHESLVLVNSGSTLSAYDTMTGANPWPGATPFRATNNSYHLLEPDPNLLLTVSAYRNLAFAALEHPLDSVRQEIKPELRFGFPLYPTFPMVKRALTAVDTGNGRIVWTLGGMYDEDSVSGNEMERFASRVSFHHSFVVDGTLYAVGATREGEAELFLFAADPETGDPLWYVSLCQGQQENTMFGRAGREPLPGIPVYADGVIYICTNLGGVVAVDIGARRVSWVTRYEALPRPITRGQQCYYRKVTFANGAPGLARDKKGNVFLLAAPTDARHLIALNANTGEQLWACEVEKRQSSLNDTTGEAPTVFIGADASYAYVGKGNQLLQIALDDGKVTATFEVGFPVDPRRTAANPLSGRPALCKNEILWPGVYGTCGIPVGNRALDERTAVSRTAPGAVGNLVVRDGMLVCSRGVNYLGRGTGAPTVEARFDFASLLAQLRGQLASGSADAEAHLRYALLASRLIGRDGFSEQGLTLAGWSSYNKYSQMGAVRASAQLISYEAAMFMAVLAVVMQAGTLRLDEIVLAQTQHGWGILTQPVAFVVFLVCAFAETNRAPFDFPEAEPELIAGYHLEYGSMKFGLFFLGEYFGMVVQCSLLTTLFLGGWTLPGIPAKPDNFWMSLTGPIIFSAKVFLLLLLFIQVRWTLPRFRFDQLMSLGWKRLIPIALANLVFTALLGVALSR